MLVPNGSTAQPLNRSSPQINSAPTSKQVNNGAHPPSSALSGPATKSSSSRAPREFARASRRAARIRAAKRASRVRASLSEPTDPYGAEKAAMMLLSSDTTSYAFIFRYSEVCFRGGTAAKQESDRSSGARSSVEEIANKY